MIKEEQALIVSFPTGTAAFEALEKCTEAGIKADLTPLPGKLSAGCGTALRALPEQQTEIVDVLTKNNVPYEEVTVIKLDA